MNVSFKGHHLAITDQAAANKAAREGKRVPGLYRFVISGNKLLLCLGNDCLAASPLAQPAFEVRIDDLTPPE